MRVILALILVVLAATARAEEPRNPGIEGTIQSQIEAFQADDFERAFTYASPTIQGLFGTPERFGTMVREGYPMVWRPAEVRYLELRDIAGRLWQKVMIRDQWGGLHMLDYQMQPDGAGWKINGVQILQMPEGNA